MNFRDIAARKRQQTRDPSKRTAAAAPPPKPPAPAAPDKALAYFDASRGCFWVQNSRGEWIQHTEAAYKRILKHEAFHQITDKEALAVTIDRHIMREMRENDVVFCQPIGGYPAGVHEIMGQRVLCTTGPKLPKPKDGKWPTFRRFVEQLLGEHAGVFYSWMKAALRSLYAGPPFRPGQMLVLAGPAGCGKSLLQNIITELLGGRVAKPYRYMTDRTTFNSDLVGSEHLMIEDEPASRDLRTRRHFGSQLKNMIAGEGQSLHRKGRDALTVTPFWRITLSVNDEPENLLVLPPLDESIDDKITLMTCQPATWDYDPNDIRERQRRRASMTAEIPAFLRFLQQHHIPARQVCPRYGVKRFHDEKLVNAIRQLQEEMQLWSIIEEVGIWGLDGESFIGTANELETKLLGADRFGRVKNVLYYHTACGVYLARLMKIYPDRIRFTEHKNSRRQWEITHPSRVLS